MDQVENQISVNEQVAPAETINHVEPVTKAPEVQETTQDRDFKELRRRKKELEETIRMQNDLIEQLKTPKHVETPIVDEFDSISDEEFIPKGKVSKLVEKKAKEIAERQVEEVFRRRDQS